ncbi:uncharacterized protein LOC144643851 [Oculina patagonica]
MEDVSSLNDANISVSSDLSESSFRPITPKKSFEASVQKSRSNSKRPESVVVEDDLSLNGDSCSGEGNESASAKKQKDRGSECSHKVIEKRRRDRINTSLGELSQLLPAQSNGKQGSGKLEKAEILELTVEYLKALRGRLTEKQDKDVKTEGAREKKKPVGAVKDKSDAEIKPVDHFGGYKDCTEEVFRFLVNVEAMDMQQPCFQRLMAHLRHQIQLLAESNSEVFNSKGKVSTENGKRTASKRSFQGNSSSSSSTSSSMGQKSGSSKGGKAKRARLHAHHSSNNKVQISSSSNGNSTSASSDNDNSSDNARDTQSDSAICLDDDLAEISGNSQKEDESGNRTNGSRVRGATTARNGNETGPSAPSIPSMLLQGGNIPLRAPFLAPPYAIPTYALHPAGTHYIPIALHPSVPLPPSPMFNGTAGQLPFGMMPPASGGGFGMPSQLPFGFPFPYVPPGVPPYGYQAPPVGFPFFNGLRKDLQGQGTTDPGNGDINGDDSSIELRISPESSANQTDTSPSNSEIESSNTDEGGS